jgi:ABC-type dipeptide transport system, periplasmic component
VNTPTSKAGRLRRAGLAIAAAVAIVLPLGACAAETQAPEQTKLTLVAFPNFPTVDYSDYVAAFHKLQMHAVYDYLMHQDNETSEPTPWIATDWAYDESRTVLSLTIREGVTFTDGTPLDAEAVVANLEHRVAAKDAYFNWSNVEGITATDDATVEIRLHEPDYGFLVAVGQTPLAALASLADLSTMATAPITSGPYLIDEANSIPDSEWAYVRNPDYWNQEAYPFDELLIKRLPDVTARVNAVLSGQVDFAPIDLQSKETLEADGFTVKTVNSTAFALFAADRAGEEIPALADVRVRQAMSYAIDRETIAETIELGYGNPTDQIFLEDSPYYLEGRNDYSYDPDRARQLMAEAGYADGLDIVSPSFTRPAYWPIIEQYLADIGVRIRFEQNEPNAMFGAMAAGELPIHLFGDLYFNWVRNLIAPEGIWNGTRYSTPEIEALLDKVSAADGDELAAAQQELAEYVYEEAWFVVLAHPVDVFAMSSELDAGIPQGFGLFGPSLWDFQRAGD